MKSDWQDPTGRTAQRLRFSVGGATLGLVTGVFLGTRGGRLAAPPGPPRLPLPGGNKPITAQEIRDSAARTLTQLLREMRPQWLRARGTDVLLPGVTNPVAKGGVRVYLNGTLLGGLETLEEVSIDAVTGIRFLNGPEAVLRYGAGDQDGAILLSTQPAP